MNKKAIQIVYWGSLWGIAEATLGYVLHMAAIQLPGVPGFVMFPVAFYFMRKSYLASGKADAVFQVALVAALIKCCDFLITGNVPIRILNPALSILLEGLAVALVFAYAERRKTDVGFASVFSMGVLWRAVFSHLSIPDFAHRSAGRACDGRTAGQSALPAFGKLCECYPDVCLSENRKNSTRC